MQCQFSPLAEISDTFVFYTYQEDANGAIVIAGRLLKVWFQCPRVPFDGYPKPVANGEAKRIKDMEFESIYKQAREQGRDMKVNGDINDPVAFVIRNPKRSSLVAAP